MRIHRFLTSLGVALLVIGALAGPRAAFAAQGDCGQPQTTGANPTASDCLFILRSAVGSSTCTPACICDTNSLGGITATDALVCLKHAVGQPVTLNCPCVTTTSSTSTTSTTASTTTTTLPVTTTTIATTTTTGPTTTTIPTTTTTGPTTTTTGGVVTTTSLPTTTTTDGGTTTTIVTTTTSPATTTTIVAASCPISAELTIAAGTQGDCTTNADCTVGTCNQTLSRCQTVTELDTGWTGIAHDSDLTDNVLVKANLDCAGPGPACGQCDIAGINPDPGYCRCANDNGIRCDQPFAEDVDNCGTGNICNCYVGPPLALSAGNTPACVVNRVATDVTGTTNVDEGSGSTQLDLRAVVYLGETLIEPCPVCGGTCTAGKPGTTACFYDTNCDTVSNPPSGDGVCGNFDPTPGDGVKGGTCHLGNNPGAPCDIDAFNQSFPAPGGGGHSLDCFPLTGKNVSGAGLIIRLQQSTGTSTLSAQIPCSLGNVSLCHCGICSLDSGVPCATNTDCAPTSAGVCQKRATLDPLPNQCDNTCTDIGGGEGQCDAPSDVGCDGVLKANGEAFIQCQSNADCDPGNIGVDGGTCALTKTRECFLPTIVATGDADPQFPVGAAIFCIAPTANGGINSVAGLPGPGRIINQGVVEFQCASGTYDPGVGCPP